MHSKLRVNASLTVIKFAAYDDNKSYHLMEIDWLIPTNPHIPVARECTPLNSILPSSSLVKAKVKVEISRQVLLYKVYIPRPILLQVTMGK